MATTRLYPDSDIANTMQVGDWSDINQDFGDADADFTRSTTVGLNHRVTLTDTPADAEKIRRVKLKFRYLGVTTQVVTGMTIKLYSGTTMLGEESFNTETGGLKANGQVEFVFDPELTKAEADDLQVYYECVSGGNLNPPDPTTPGVD